MENEVYKENYKDFIIKIFQDENAESPDTWKDENVFLVYKHKDFTVERKYFEPENIYRYLNLLERIDNFKAVSTTYFAEDNEITIRKYNRILNILEQNLKDYSIYFDYYIFQVNAYIHSGVALSLGKEYPFDCKFDVSTTGYILVKKDTIKTEPFTVELTKELAEGLIKDWNDYLSGNVFGYAIYDVKEYTKCWLNGDIDEEVYLEEQEIDSCWGHYGNYKENALVEAKEYIDNLLNNK